MASLKRARRNRVLLALLLPLIVCVFFAGWVLYVTGRPGSGSSQGYSNKNGVVED